MSIYIINIVCWYNYIFTAYNDSAPKPDGVRKKQTSLAREEEMVLKKLKHDMDMEMLRFKSSEDSKEKEL